MSADVGAGRYRTWLGLGVAAGVVLRARFVLTPLTTDEGGFVAVSRAWWAGHDLYGRQAGDVWVDRPQGGLLLFRGADAVLGWIDVTAAVRALAILAGVVAVVAVADLVRSLATARAALIAAVLVAVLGAAPRLEGFVANGELLTGAASSAALALGVRALGRSEGRTAPLAVAGVVAGLSMSIKQSGVDAALVLVLAAATGMVAAQRSRRDRARDVVVLAAGTGSVLAALVAHGVATGAADWWFAMVGYRASSRSGWRGADLDRLGSTALDALVVLGPLAAALLAAAVVTRRGACPRNEAATHAGRPVPRLLVLWLAVSVLSFWAGGQYFRHYWLTLVWPLAALGGVLLDHVRRPLLSIALAVVVALPLFDAARLIVLDRTDVPEATSQDWRLVPNERVADRMATRPRAQGEAPYALCASAALYALTRDDPPLPFLWFDGVTRIEGAGDLMIDLLDGPHPPVTVAVFQPADRCDPTGRLARVLTRRYCPTDRIGPVRLLTLRGHAGARC